MQLLQKEEIMNSNTNVIVNWKNSKDFNEFLQSHLTDENRLTVQEIGMVRMLIYFEHSDTTFSTETARDMLKDGLSSIHSTINKLIEKNLLVRHSTRNNGKKSFQYELTL